MARPREFDRDAALKRAMTVFWAKGYAGTSTDDLLEAMSIGRQSMYGAFGDKPTLYVEALERYQQDSIMAHFDRLRSGAHKPACLTDQPRVRHTRPANPPPPRPTPPPTRPLPHLP